MRVKIYVRPTGNDDTGEGTLTRPFRTVRSRKIPGTTGGDPLQAEIEREKKEKGRPGWPGRPVRMQCSYGFPALEMVAVDPSNFVMLMVNGSL